MTPTVSNLHYGPSLQVANAVARGAEWLGLPVGAMNARSMVDRARRETGLEDLGDERFQQPMRHIVDLVARQDGITPLARVLLRQAFILSVKNRLKRQAWLTAHPEILQQPLKRPVFVLGFPRTGTTVLQHLLALGDQRRGLNFWEITIPTPVHEDRSIDFAKRRRTVDWMIRAAYQVAPEMGEVHYIDNDTLEECWPLFGSSFAVLNWDLQSGISQIGDWLMNDWDMTLPYTEYRDTLKILLDRRPADQLVLKCPEHLFFVDALLEVFPDACIVQTHRDPYATVGSYCSLMSLQWRTLYGHIDRRRIGAYMEKRLHTGVQRAMASRAKADPARFYDVQFTDLITDPAGVVQGISEHFDLALPADNEALVTGHLAKKRADARGKHHYDPGDYGLRREHVYDVYSDYLERFDIQCS